MSETVIVIDPDRWVERVKSNPSDHLERQATQVLLGAVGYGSGFRGKAFLKGGTLLGLVYDSPRQTVDVDFTVELEPNQETIDAITTTLNDNFLRAASVLSYPDLVLRVQTVRKEPRPSVFEDANAPALKLTVAYAKRDSRQMKGLERGNCDQVLKIDVSFREPVVERDIIRLGEGGPELGAYSPVDVVAEKLRALLQQEIRDRNRRQDVYDIAFMVEQVGLTPEEHARILPALRLKCEVRDITPTREGFRSPELRRRAAGEWHTLATEVEILPDFDERFTIVQEFYESLPWDD